MRLRSLKTRFILASFLWTGGLLGISHLISIALISHRHVVQIPHHMALLSVAIPCLIFGFIGVRRGLSPFDELRKRLASVREGRDTRLEGTYPSEVEPLVHDLNALLDNRENIRQTFAGRG